MELFEFRPINFLVKPIDKSRVLKLIEKYILITEQDNSIFEYKKRSDYYKLSVSDIIYFESCRRKIIIHYKDGVDEFYESMEKVLRLNWDNPLINMLSLPIFIFCPNAIS